ncbi:MAG: energy transducer TonB [Candidatus Kerfeldbacteria bacterium]|nr:energy transducer TonB [Candidatus Kerfeldbacteria bacterium]
MKALQPRVVFALLVTLAVFSAFCESKNATKSVVPKTTTVLVRAFIQPDGRVTEALPVQEQAADKDLQRKATAIVLQSTFKPAETARGPVAVWMIVPVEFRADDGETTPPRLGRVTTDEG